MANPAEILNKRYGDVFLSKTKSLNIVSEENNNEGENYSTYSGVIDMGTINPVIMVALVKNNGPSDGQHLRDLNWAQLHVRSYRSWNEVKSTGINLVDTEPQKPVSGALNDASDFSMRSVHETKNSKTYKFDNSEDGKIILFTSTPNINIGGNDLPRKTTLLANLNDANFVYLRN